MAQPLLAECVQGLVPPAQLVQATISFGPPDSRFLTPYRKGTSLVGWNWDEKGKGELFYVCNDFGRFMYVVQESETISRERGRARVFFCVFHSRTASLINHPILDVENERLWGKFSIKSQRATH